MTSVPSISSPSSSRLLVPLALGALYLIWGSTYLGISISVKPGGFAAFQMNSLRFITAGVLLFLFLRARGVAIPSRRQWLNGALIGVLLVIGGNGLTTLALKWGAPGGISATVIATTTLWAGLWSMLWGNRPRNLEWLGMAVGLGGVAVLTLEGSFRANPAIFIQFAAPMLWAFGSILSRHRDMPQGVMSTAVQMIAGGVVALPISLAMGETWAMPSAEAWGAFAYLVVFGSWIGYSAYNYVLGQVRPAVATSYAYINPIVALALGYWFLHEPVDTKTLIALPIILCGVGLIALAQNRAAKPRAPESR
jgi:drug/metabolite transporter (DMT)-like permease